MISRWTRWLVALVFLGIALRAAQWAYRAPVWHDERALVQNIENKTARELLGPLMGKQAAPPAFLLTLRGLYVCCGDSSLLFRLPSLLYGSAALIFFALLCRRLLDPLAAIAMTAVFALSDRLIWHSAEIKPYAGDLFIACLELWIFFSAQGRSRRIIFISLAAMAGIWVSFPTLFVYAALMVVLAWESLRDRRSQWVWAAGAAIFAASFVPVYLLVVRPQRTADLSLSWISDYLPRSTPAQWPGWLLAELYRLCDYSSKNLGSVILVLAGLGIYAQLRRRDYRCWLALTLPIFITLLAACAAIYPFGGSRATLFLVPEVFLLSGFGLAFLENLFQPWGKVAAWGTAIVLVAWMGGLAAYRLARPRIRTPAIRSLAAYLHAYYSPADPVYIWEDINGPGEFIDYWDHHVGRPGDRLYDFNEADFHGRFWIVLIAPSQFPGRSSYPPLTNVRAVADEKAHYLIPGGKAYLFEQR